MSFGEPSLVQNCSFGRESIVHFRVSPDDVEGFNYLFAVWRPWCVRSFKLGAALWILVSCFCSVAFALIRLRLYSVPPKLCRCEALLWYANEWENFSGQASSNCVAIQQQKIEQRDEIMEEVVERPTAVFLCYNGLPIFLLSWNEKYECLFGFLRVFGAITSWQLRELVEFGPLVIPSQYGKVLASAQTWSSESQVLKFRWAWELARCRQRFWLRYIWLNCLPWFHAIARDETFLYQNWGCAGDKSRSFSIL